MKLDRNEIMTKFFKALVVGALLASASGLVEAKESDLVDGLAESLHQKMNKLR